MGISKQLEHPSGQESIVAGVISMDGYLAVLLQRAHYYFSIRYYYCYYYYFIYW
jgi:hypothetical protein